MVIILFKPLWCQLWGATVAHPLYSLSLLKTATWLTTGPPHQRVRQIHWKSIPLTLRGLGNKSFTKSIFIKFWEKTVQQSEFQCKNDPLLEMAMRFTHRPPHYRFQWTGWKSIFQSFGCWILCWIHFQPILEKKKPSCQSFIVRTIHEGGYNRTMVELFQLALPAIPPFRLICTSIYCDSPSWKISMWKENEHLQKLV